MLERIQSAIRIVTIREFLQSDMRTGEIDLDCTRRLLAAIVNESMQRGVYRVMIDARGNPTGLSTPDIVELVAGAESLGFTPRHRIAILRVRPDALRRAKYIGALASSKGLNVRAFDDYEAALAFLNEGPDPPR
ncbi:MAG: hypothetical protein MUF79_02270 [Burkholderiales bacterium]|jgi:hypothetical protein|nr:hypothetical protein [Burkholderiales bacterium]